MIPLLAVLIIICQFIDFATTYRILTNGGVERNSVVKYAMDMLGMEAGLFVCKFYAGVFVGAGAMLGWFGSEIGFLALLALAILYVAVAAHNLREVNRG